MGEENQEHNDYREGDEGTSLGRVVETLPTPEFVKVEKNLASLGFFTPSSKRTRNEKSKTVSVTVVMDGRRIDAKATIAPTALFGLPITADQDKWLALHKILADIQTRDGKVENPVSFSSAELLALLKIYKNSGKNYHDVSEWLDVMVGTTIISEGAVYLAGKRTFGKDTFHVFDRAVSFGKELPDGSIANKNYVWLSQWQLQNINDHHQLPIDLDTYRELKNHIAKALVPLLQVWLYATREEGVFEKRYDELCQILNVRQWNYTSKIKEKLGPSLDELKQFGYLAEWEIAKMSDNRSFKIVLYHGEKFHRDHRARLDRKKALSALPGNDAERGHRRGSPQHDRPAASFRLLPIDSAATPRRSTFDPQLVAEITRRGITERKAEELLANVKPNQDIIAQLEFGEYMVENSRTPITNPPGFYIRVIQSNMSVPESFETKAKRKAREERERKERDRQAAEDARQNLEFEYDDYCQQETERYIAENPATFEDLKSAKWQQNRERFQSLSPDMITSMANSDARREMRKQLPLPTLEEFISQKKQGTAFSLKPVAVLAAADARSGDPVADVHPAIDVPSEGAGVDSPLDVASVKEKAPAEPDAFNEPTAEVETDMTDDATEPVHDCDADISAAA